jgi:metal-sulfur cluster biosynthetic enzyme
LPDASIEVTQAEVLGALSEVLDPELPVSVTDLGLIRGVEVHGSTVRVRITYTTLGCPCTELIQEDVEERLLRLDGVERVEVEETFDAWTRQDVSPRGLLALRRVGLT